MENRILEGVIEVTFCLKPARNSRFQHFCAIWGLMGRNWAKPPKKAKKYHFWPLFDQIPFQWPPLKFDFTWKWVRFLMPDRLCKKFYFIRMVIFLQKWHYNGRGEITKSGFSQWAKTTAIFLTLDLGPQNYPKRPLGVSFWVNISFSNSSFLTAVKVTLEFRIKDQGLINDHGT